MKSTELRKKTTGEIKDSLVKVRKEITETKEKIMLGKEKKVSVLKGLKKDVARIQTVLREKEILESIKQ